MEELAIDGHPDELGHHVERELDGVGDLADGLEAGGIDELHHEAHQLEFFDSGGLKVGGFGGDVMEECIEGAGGECSHGDEVLAEAAAVGGLMIEGFGYVVDGDEFGLDEQIA